MIAFQCAHSGLLFPKDFFKEWGRKYGRGCGPDAFSTVWDSDYHTVPAEGRGIDSPEQVMHPVRFCGAQLDRVEVSQEVFNANQALHDGNDPTSSKRVAIIRAKQLANPRCHVSVRNAKIAMDQIKNEVEA
jgi:hypothetical protein